MNLTREPAMPPAISLIGSPKATSAPLVPARLRRRDDAIALDLLEGYGRRGGLATGDELALRLREHWRQPISVVARWVVARKVISFGWRGQLLLPLFQFEFPRGNPHPGVVEAAMALHETMDELAVAAWFLRPQPWLGGAAPADRVVDDPRAVVEAALAWRPPTLERCG